MIPDQMTPLVSIVIPCYNARGYVGEAIESALAQTYTSVETIVIDDGSTDGSLEVVRSFGARIRWCRVENQGASVARNLGVKMARGPLIQFLDSDDLLKPEKLSIQVPVSIRSPGSIVYSEYENTDHERNPVPGLSAPSESKIDPVCFILSYAGLATPAPIHWRNQLLSIDGFRPDLPCAQERDLHLRLACAGVGFIHLPRSLFIVRRTSNSLSSDYLKVLDQHESLAITAHEVLLSTGGLTEERCSALAAFVARDARAYLQRGFPRKAKRYFRLARYFHPKGGLDAAYRPSTRLIRRILGPTLVERLVSIKRHGWAKERIG